MPKPAHVEPETLLIREIREQHEGEWLLVRMLEWGLPTNDTHGQLVAHGRTRGAMIRAEERIRKSEPRAPLIILMGGTGFDDVETLRRAIARLKEEGKWVSANAW